MKKLKILTSIFAMSLMITSCDTPHTDSSGATYDEELKINFNLKNSLGEKISPYVYGTFIEHIEKCIYDGIWAEKILDRKFVAPIGEDVSQWKKGTDKLIESDNVNTYSGGYSAHFVTGASMYQRNIMLNKDSGYDGYFYAKGNGKVSIEVSSSDGNKIGTTVDINSTIFEKYEYKLNIKNEGKHRLTFKSLNGEFYMDSLSLMKDDNIDGMRYDTLQLLKELNAPFYRWPGGNFVSGYDFYDGIGARDKRESKRNLEYAGQLSDYKNDGDRLAADLTNIESNGFYSVYEPNDFGIDEFIIMCRYLDAEPNIVLNSGLGSVQMAIDEVEYINGTSGHYASLRPSIEPYNVKYFSIGNEMNGDWQLGHMPIDDYCAKHNGIAAAIKKISPDIKIIAVGDNSSNWTQKMVDNCKNNMDLTSEHFYAIRNEDNVKEHILSLKDQARWRIQNHKDIDGIGNIKMSIDEYAYNQAQTQSRLKDGMGVAACLNEFIKNADVVEAACYSSTVNAVQGQIFTDSLKAYLEGSGMISSLYSNYMEDYYLQVACNSRFTKDYIEVSATVNQDKTLMSISIINTSDLTLKVTNDNIKEYISRSYVYSDTFEAKNDSTKEEIKKVKEEILNASIVEPRSVTIIQVKI